VILADEPTGNLDRHSGTEMLGLLRNASDERRQTIVIVTHDPFAASRADRVVFLKDGRLVHQLPLGGVPNRIEVLAGAMAELEL
ncbi:MAG TPA: hypothetical protein VIH26_08415, partial [Anaerolineales bacterium]